MNNDLISRSELKKALHNFFDGNVIDEPTYILRDVFCYIDNAPTVEMLPMCMAKDEAICEEMTTDGHCNYLKPCPNKEERPQGEWTIKYINGCSYYICSVCKEMHIDKGNFCPNCGADMRGKEE